MSNLLNMIPQENFGLPTCHFTKIIHLRYMILQDFIVKVKYDVIFKVDKFGQVISLKAIQLDTSFSIFSMTRNKTISHYQVYQFLPILVI